MEEITGRHYDLNAGLVLKMDDGRWMTDATGDDALHRLAVLTCCSVHAPPHGSATH